MERLTARSQKNNLAYLTKVKPNEQEVDSQYPDTLKAILESFQQLAKYEDNGQTPEEQAKMIAFVGNDMESNALLLKEVSRLRAEIDGLKKVCDTCQKCFATCNNGQEGTDFFFGTGLGCDDVYKCKPYDHEPKGEVE